MSRKALRLLEYVGAPGALLLAVALLTAACSRPTLPGGPTPTALSPQATPSSRPLRLNQPIRFERLSLEQGLSQSSVYAILRDSKGFMWFATQEGLNKYDGYSFTVYKHVPGDPYSLSHNFVWTLYADRTGIMWVGTGGGGLDRFDRRTGRFFHYPSDSGKDSLSGGIVRAICEGQGDVLWIGTQGGGLNELDRATGRFKHYYHDRADPHSLSSNVVLSVYTDRAGSLWVGTDGGGLDRLDRATGRFVHYRNDPRDPHSLSDDTVWAIREDRAGALWVGTDGGLNRLDPSTGQFTRYQNDPGDPHSLSSNAVRSIYEDWQGALWVGTDGGGLNLFARGQFIHYRNDLTDPHSLSNDSIEAIYQDPEGVLWIGTHIGGINKSDLSTRPFVHYKTRPGDVNSLSHNPVWSIYEDRDGVLWIGTDGGGLNRFDRAAGRFTHYRHASDDPHSLGDDTVLAIYEDRTGALWLGLSDGRVDQLDRATGRFTHYPVVTGDSSGSTSDSIRVLYEDRAGVLWAGTSGAGLYRLDRPAGRFIPYECDWGCLSSNYIGAIYEDRAGALWVGCSGAGLDRLDREKRQVTHYLANPDDPTGLSIGIVMSIYEDSSGRLWIGTFGGGLNRLERETGSFTRYRERDGLPNDVVYGILEDNQGFLWLSTNRGLSRFDPRTETFKNYDVSDGLPSNEFNSGAYFKGRSGELFFGHIDGFTAFYPEDVQEDNPYVPPVVLTSITQGGEKIDLGASVEDVTELTLRWPNNFFEFEFTALSYVQPKGNQYAYRLEGLEDDWIYVGTRRLGRYTNLPGGKYTLRIKGSNNDGVWNEEGVAIAVTVVPPFWETWWFRGLAFLMLVVSVVGGYRWRVRSVEARSRELEAQIAERTAALRREVDQRLQVEEALRQSEMDKAIAAERSRLARDLHDAVTQTLFSASLIAEALPTLWEKDQEEGRRHLEELRRLTRGALAEMRTLLLELRPAALVEADLGDLLRQLAEAVTGREGIPIAVTVEGQCTLPHDVHITLYRIAQEALNNVVKHAKAGQAAVSLRCLTLGSAAAPETIVELCVGDDGRGFDPQCIPSDGLGLDIMRERAQSIGATLTITSQPGHGTQVQVVVRLA